MARFLQRVIASIALKSQPRKLQVVRCVSSQHLTEYSSSVQFSTQKRWVHKNIDEEDTDVLRDHTCEVSNFDDYLTNYKPIVKVMIQTLREILDISLPEANKIIIDYPQLKKRSRANVLNNYYNLLERGVQKSTIRRNVWLLAHENNKIEDKLKCIDALNMNNDHLVSWLRLTQEELENYVHYCQNDMYFYTYNKVEYLADRLKCSIEKLAELTVRYPFILKIPISFLEKKLNVLQEYNVNNERILNDLWVLRYSENHIRHRCELYKDTGNLEIRPWAIRCPLRVIARAVERNYIRRGLLKSHTTVSEYLLTKLKVNEETLDLALTKWPHILRINLSKLDRIINLLHQNRICSKEILRNDRIFYFNTETIKNRIEILKKNNIAPTLTLLVLSECAFERNIKKILLQQEVLKEYSVKEYLVKKLNISEQTLEKTSKKWPSVLRVNVHKLDQLISMLQQYGIKGDEIIRYPRVFFFNLETLRERLEILRAAKLIPKVNLLTYSRKSFDKYVRLH
ncbi:transcription termination factor, mitochondrial [Pseudomyrmex gracilis]|uniref:transcription termination factor, mitochondrial n=1 Tax=Pseudomyrmex gracilis TaxID=219809 RepID=UPI000994F369|nr:transcription termination factor, mitochondrial [Pseudomyrmex gracilis]